MNRPVIRMRSRVALILCLGVIPTGLSYILTKALTKGHSFGDNLCRVGLIVLQPFSVMLHDRIPYWMTLPVFYLQFPTYAALLFSVVRSEFFPRVGKVLLWLHLSVVVVAGVLVLNRMSN